MIDWQLLTINLRRDYKSLSSIAKEVGSDWQHLNRLARGETKEPRFSVGVRLIDLHFDYCKEKHKSIMHPSDS